MARPTGSVAARRLVYSRNLYPLPPRARLFLLLALLPIFTALAIYAVTWAFIWDEGFHLIAAHLIASGKRPYLDFCFPQTPLNAYLNAAILIAFGNNWRPVHFVAALYICAAIWLVSDFIQTRLPNPPWRTPCALTAAVLFGLNSVVVQFGPAGQAYAIAMLLGVAAFRAALIAVRTKTPWFALVAGLCASSAAASTLLTAPIAAVLFVWLLLANTFGSRVQKATAYLLACIVPFAPVLWLFSQGPRQTIFNILQYQTLFRRTNWGDANLHDLDALTSWINSPEALVLLVLCASGLFFLFRKNTDREFLLAAALAAALVLFISTAHPTFERYYSVAVPYIAIVAALGFYVLGEKIFTPVRPRLAATLIVAFTWAVFFRSLFDQRDDDRWSTYEDVAREVAAVTPLNANLFADELVFFLLQRDPPEGLEFSYAEKLDLPTDQEKLFHVISQEKLKRQMQSGHFATFQTCRESTLNYFEPAASFRQHTEPADCDLFWQPKSAK